MTIIMALPQAARGEREEGRGREEMGYERIREKGEAIGDCKRGE